MLDLEEKEAISVFSYTLLASGNCFSVLDKKGEKYNIVNFYHENIEKVEFPIKIRVLGGNTAIIADEKINDDLYNDRFCTCCCPKNLLPLPQKLKYELNVKRGVIKEHKVIVNGKETNWISYEVKRKEL